MSCKVKGVYVYLEKCSIEGLCLFPLWCLICSGSLQRHKAPGTVHLPECKMSTYTHNKSFTAVHQLRSSSYLNHSRHSLNTHALMHTPCSKCSVNSPMAKTQEAPDVLLTPHFRTIVGSSGPFSAFYSAHCEHLNAQLSGPPSLFLSWNSQSQRKQKSSDNKVDVLFLQWGCVCMD